MAHIALYRTWRPQAFDEIVGQKHIVQTLQNALREGRFSHAYLFSGPRGTGKTSAAKILAKAVNCEKGPSIEPCNECSACLRMTEGSILDVIEIDAASNRGVDEIREIRDKVRFAPTEVRRKVYIIDEVHMLTTEAFNALLKTLEEPPGHVMFILATTEPHRLPATIISRCQRFDFRRISLREQVERLEYVCDREKIKAEPEALEYIARLSDGGMRDALSLLDQIASFSENEITYRDALAITGGVASEQFGQLAKAIREKDTGLALTLIDQWIQEGRGAAKCLENLIFYFRDLLLISMVPDSEIMTDRIIDVEAFRSVASTFSHAQLIEIIETLNTYQTEMKYSAQPQTLFEIAVLKICSHKVNGSVPNGQNQDVDQQFTHLHKKIQQLEQQVSQLSQQLGSGKVVERSPLGLQSKPSLGSSRPASTQRSSNINLEPFLGAKEHPELRSIVQKWSQVLARVREQKITVHAWLIDGEPVSFYEGSVLLAFKSAMHRETTEKPANKQLIEQAMAEIYERPFQLFTVMRNEWTEVIQPTHGLQISEMSLELDSSEGTASDVKEVWVKEAIQLFGEDLVKIKED